MILGRRRRREHPNQHYLLLLRVLRNFRLRMRTPKGTHATTTKRGETGHAQKLLPVRATSGQGLFRSIWRNFRLRMRRTYFRTRSRYWCHVTDVTFGHVQWSDPPHDPPQMWLELYPYTTIQYIKICWVKLLSNYNIKYIYIYHLHTLRHMSYVYL
jgi:hypothetical protein